MTHLYCTRNQLTALDVSKNTALTNLDCQENQLTALDLSSNNTLSTLKCDFIKKFARIPLARATGRKRAA